MASRKFILAVSVVVASFVFRAVGWITESTLATIVIPALGLYFGGNVADKKLNGGGQ